MGIATNKSHPENSPEGQQAKKDTMANDASLSEVNKLVEAEQKQGFRGVEADPTPNENYTVAGVTSGQPTPETDKAQAKQVREYQDELFAKVEGVSGNNN